jgi:hypothetical protein
MARRVALLLALLLALSSSIASQDLRGTLLVANRTGGSISFFDLASGIEMARVPIGPAIPHQVAVSADGRVALTVGPCARSTRWHGRCAGAVSVGVLKSRALVNRLALHEGRKGAGGFGIHIVGERVFVSDRMDRSLFIMDLDDFKSRRTLVTGHDDPDGLAVSPVRVAVLERTQNGR